MQKIHRNSWNDSVFHEKTQLEQADKCSLFSILLHILLVQHSLPYGTNLLTIPKNSCRGSALEDTGNLKPHKHAINYRFKLQNWLRGFSILDQCPTDLKPWPRFSSHSDLNTSLGLFLLLGNQRTMAKKKKSKGQWHRSGLVSCCGNSKSQPPGTRRGTFVHIMVR